MKIVFLGTNGWYDSPTGNSISILIETGAHNILLDAGNGLFKADRYLNKDKPASLFISHTHLDHIIGLHLLNKFEFMHGLKIYGQPGIEAALQSIFRAPYSLPFASLPFPVNIIEFDGMLEYPAFSVQTLAMHHSVPTFGFRFIIENKIITYCPDTGYCDNAVELAKEADLLITECAFRSGEESEFWPHLNPESAARIAFEANARHLALIHFDAFRYPTIDSRQHAEAKAKIIFSNTIATRDEMVFEL